MLKTNAWLSRFPDAVITTPQENPYFLLIEKCRQLGKKVYALDASQKYIGFRFGEQDLGTVTRNMIWANALPKTGRGIVFGGGSHFTHFKGMTMQSFLQKKNKNVEFYKLDLIQ